MPRGQWAGVLAGSLVLALALDVTNAWAEVVVVKYRGPVDLATFNCPQIKSSSVVERICYDPAERYVIVRLTGTYYHYCNVPEQAVRDWLVAGSLGRHYNMYIKGRFDCRGARIPEYRR